MKMKWNITKFRAMDELYLDDTYPELVDFDQISFSI